VVEFVNPRVRRDTSACWESKFMLAEVTLSTSAFIDKVRSIYALAVGSSTHSSKSY
jgi:hypothetical protein